MYPDILDKNQKEIITYFEPLEADYYLAGGTAIALQIGHRKSIDFDFFSKKRLMKSRIKHWSDHLPFSENSIILNNHSQIDFNINGVKVSFIEYPFSIRSKIHFHGMPMPSLITLGAMKAYALSRRAKWKDYVDLFFLLNGPLNFKQIINEANQIYGDAFRAILFRSQLSSFHDIDYTEKVYYMNKPISDEKIKESLTEFSLSEF